MAQATLDGREPGFELFVDPQIARERRRRRSILIGRIALCLGLLLHGTLRGPHLDKLVFSAPSEIASRLWEWTLDGTLWNNLVVTAEEVVLGYALGAVSAVTPRPRQLPGGCSSSSNSGFLAAPAATATVRNDNPRNSF